MTRPRLLDLFCGAGGAGMGYRQAGFDVVGVDISPQPQYPGEFIQLDALTVPVQFARDFFAAVHASPPCQAYSANTVVSGSRDDHPDLIAPIRGLLEATGRPYVIENVPGAPLIDPALICGVALGLRIPEGVLRRHRLFETNWPLTTPGCGCRRGDGKTLGVYGGGPTSRPRVGGGGGRPTQATAEQSQRLMGMPWANGREIREAIPPAYTELIGSQLLRHLEATTCIYCHRPVDDGYDEHEECVQGALREAL